MKKKNAPVVDSFPLKEKLLVECTDQRRFITFGLTLWVQDDIKEAFPDAKPLNMMTVGFQNIKDSLEPYRKEVTNYIIPLLTGLSPEQLTQLPEIVVWHRPTKHIYLKITHPSPHVKEIQPISRSSRAELHLV